MECKITFSDLKHDDLVNLLSDATYSNSAILVNVSDKFTELKNKGEGECREDEWANVLLNGGKIEIADIESDADDDPYEAGTNPHKIMIHNSFMDTDFEVWAYDISLKDIERALNSDEGQADAKDFFDENGDMYTAWNLIQIAMFNEIIYG